MTEPTPNVDLLNRTLAYIEEHPEEWRQDWWASRTPCGTAYCFAGTAVRLADPDAEFAWDGDLIDEDREGSSCLVDGTWVSDRAGRLLGLCADQEAALFFAGNTLDDLRRIVSELTGGAR